MKKTIGSYEFVEDMMDIRPDNFTREGLFALYDYFTEYEDSCDTEIEFDPIAICCEYIEDSIQNICENYSICIGDDIEEILDYLRDRTEVIVVDDENIIIKNY